VKIEGCDLSGSKVVRGMLFGWDSEGCVLFLTPSYKTNLVLTPPPQTGTIQHATAAKVAVFTCALDIAQTETDGTALIKNLNKTTRGKEKHLAKVQCCSDF
jgi:T-complex protein 1 subunit theta